LSFIEHLRKRDQRFHADIPGLVLHRLHRGIAIDVRIGLDPTISNALASKKDLQGRMLIFRCSAQRDAGAMDMACRSPLRITRLAAPMTVVGSLSFTMANVARAGW
jgi:hypothetical protein